MPTRHTARMLLLAVLVIACGSPSDREPRGAERSDSASSLELARRGASKDSAACWPMRVGRPKSADSVMAIRPAPHADSAMALRPVCPPAE
jgi:hypothetical protein